MTTLDAALSTFAACAAQSLRAEFGVCRGETITRFEDLNLGDIYLVKHDATWSPVVDMDGTAGVFCLDLAANLPQRALVTLAHLIFMTTTGRRADVYATQSNGQLYLVSDVPLQMGLEYVLISIERTRKGFEPSLVQTPTFPAAKTATLRRTHAPLYAVR